MNRTKKRRCAYLIFTICFLMLLGACKKEAAHDPDVPLVITPLQRPQGTSTGAATTKVIGAAGGTITSADNDIEITIPAGALSAETTIGIEPVTNTNIAGIGKSYRLTPHGQQFNKPVTLSYSWADYADSIGLMQTLGLAYQMEDGVWKFVGADSFDANQKTVSFKTKHFSDWSLMNRLSLSPYQAEVETGAKLGIEALIFTESEIDDLFVPLTSDTYDEPGYPVGVPAALPAKFIKSWKLNGPGKMTKKSGNEVEYEAPSSVDGNASATVVLELNAPVAGQYLLLSNITILGDSWIELSIGGGAPVKFPASTVVKTGARYLLSNPENEGGGYFLLAWNGGVGDHSFDLENDGTHFHFETSATTYISRYIPFENSPVLPSGGSVNITKLSDGKAEGTFTITNVGYGPTLMETTAAQGKFKAKLFVQ